MIKQLIKYCLLIIYVQYTSQACQKNCILCDQNDVCLFCDVTKSFLLIDDKCQYSVVDFCELLNIKGVCLGCKKDYFLDPSTLKCVQIDPKSLIENCYYYQTAVSCKICNAQYYLTGGVCKEVPTPISGCLYYSNESGTFCEQCDTNFILAQDKKSCLGKTQSDKCQTFNMAQCKTCKPGYVIEYNKYLDQIFNITSQTESQFLMNYVLGVSQLHDYGICQKIKVDNCQEIESLSKCKVCNEGYYLNENGICEQNPEDGVPNCFLFESNTKCLQCNNGYYLKTNQQCLKSKEILFCDKVSPIANYELCIECKKGYYLLEENECKERKEIIFNCSILDPQSELCNTCMPNFYLSQNKMQCFADIQNCQVHKENDNNTGLICTLCKDGYYFVSETSKCIEGQSSMNCAQFQTPEKCKICKNGFIMDDSNNCIAHQSVSNCITYSLLEKNGCQTCENSFMLFQNTNFCDLVLSEVPHCKKYLSRSECDICEDGYYFVTTKICAEIPQEENCLQRIKEESQCEKCKYDFKLEGGKCIPLPKYLFEFCEKDNRDGKLLFTEYICDNCKLDYYPSNFDKNFICLNDDFIGDDLLTNCKYYKKVDDNFECFMCQNEFVLEDNQCIEQCSSTHTLIVYDLNILEVQNEVGFTDKKQQLLKQNKCVENIDQNCTIKNFDVFDKTRNVCSKCPQLLQPVIEDNHYTNFIYKDDGSYYGQEMFNFVYNFGVSCVNMQDKVFNEVENCEVYTQLPDDSYSCFKCKFGYNPKIPNDDYVITKCDLMDIACLTTEYVLGIDNYKDQFYNAKAPLSSYFTCHKCKDSSKIPFVFITEKYIGDTTTDLDRLQYAKNPLQNYEYSVECLSVNFNILEVPENKWKFMDTSISYSPLQYQRCALGMVNVNYRQDASQSDLIGATKENAGVYCVACKPKFAKVLNNNYDTTFPYMLYKCIEIENCFDSTWFNNCSLCNAGYTWEFDTTVNQINYAKCIENTKENCLVINSGFCILCQKGYRLNENLNQCEKIIAPFCEDDFMTPYTPYKIVEGQTNYSQIIYYIPENPGCNKCQPKYSLVLINEPTHICSYNSFWIAKKNFGNNFYLENCLKISFTIDENFECVQCNEEYIMTEDKKCVKQESYPNCKVSDNGECSVCRDNFYIDDGNCIQGQISFCKTYQNFESCSQCQDGYYVIDGLCKKGDIVNCLVYRNEKECLQCSIGFMLVTSKDQKSACYPLEINRNCEQYDTSNYKKNTLTCLKCLKGFAESTQGDYLKSTCLQTNIIANCLIYDTQILFTESTLLCTKCEDQFYVDDKGNCTLRTYRVTECISYVIDKDECLQCTDGYFLTPEKQCKQNPKGINNCEQYLNQFECGQCKPLYYLDQNTCFEIQAENVIANCLYYGNFDKCIYCQDKHYFQDGGCVKGEIDKCLQYEDQNNCKTCEDGQGIITNDDGNKICFVINLQNCEIPDPLNVKQCQKCEQNFYLLNGICEPITTTIDNCILYLSPETCGQCRPGFMLSLDFKKCNVGTGIYVVEGECEHTIELNNMICSGCKKYHYMKELICEPCVKFSADQGCMFCNKDDSQCLMCDKGYYMNPEGLCQEWIDETPPPEPQPEQPVEEVESSLLNRLFIWFFMLLSQLQIILQKIKFKINPYNKQDNEQIKIYRSQLST